MRRIVAPTRIVFVDRNLGWSLLCFGSSSIALMLCAIARDNPSHPGSRSLSLLALLGSGTLFLSALYLLFRKRAYVVDRTSRQLTIVDRRVTGARKFSCALEQVRVKMEQRRLKHAGKVSYELWVGSIWLDIKGRGNVLFLDDLRGSEARTLATRLAGDLGRPLEVIERDDWQ